MDPHKIMYRALELANLTAQSSPEDIPVGAVIIDAQGRIIAEGSNQREKTHDPTGHAEIVAIRKASQTLGSWRLTGLTLVVTLEPCAMCAGAILASRLDRVIFGAFNDQEGAAGSRLDLLRDRVLGTNIEVVSRVLNSECTDVLTKFFSTRR